MDDFNNTFYHGQYEVHPYFASVKNNQNQVNFDYDQPTVLPTQDMGHKFPIILDTETSSLDDISYIDEYNMVRLSNLIDFLSKFN